MVVFPPNKLGLKQTSYTWMVQQGWESIAIDASEIQRSTWDTVDGSEIPNNHRLDGAKTL